MQVGKPETQIENSKTTKSTKEKKYFNFGTSFRKFFLDFLGKH